MQGVRVQFLVRELRSHTPPGLKNQSINQEQCCSQFSKDFKNGPRLKKKKKVSATVRGGKRKTELAWGLASHMTAPAWLCVPGGPSHCGPSLPYTAALGTWHRHHRHSGPPARLLQGEPCLCPAKRLLDTTEPMQAAANSQPRPSCDRRSTAIPGPRQPPQPRSCISFCSTDPPRYHSEMIIHSTTAQFYS